MSSSPPRAPSLADLPPPPAGKRGWPWTEASPALPAGAAPPPSITVVVPSYQQGAFLEETLRSVLLQGYPDLELLVMDGGSTDETLAVIRRYERWLAGWVSEKDGGQSAAINKGWRRARGELVTWLNSDDLLMPGWAAEASAAFVADPTLDLVSCDVHVIDQDSRIQALFTGHPAGAERIVVHWRTPFAQQGFLVRRSVVEAGGYVDESLHFAMDTELWLRLILSGRKLRHLPRPLGAVRVHPATKTSQLYKVLVANMLEVTRRFGETAPPDLRELAERARRRQHWNAAHINYDNRDHVAARRSALRHLSDDGWRALPRVAGMVTLSLLGDRGHDLLALWRRARSAA
ncbi:MAG TPA: glycosyltransferase family 2 protein [Polyangia bacterium]|nr:glycosyltransferase family 2 protein [Polyangia bacterium]